jgi:hypothetical protein
MPVELTRHIIERAFDAIGAMAAERGLVVDASCPVLASDVRGASGDVDAVFLTEVKLVRRMADKVARRMGLPLDWINEAVRRTAPPIGNPEPNLLPFGEYPRSGGSAVGLRVFLPTPSYLLVLKILAARLEQDAEKIQSDLDDAVALMKVTKLATREALVELVKECYPNVAGIATLRLLRGSARR